MSALHALHGRIGGTASNKAAAVVSNPQARKEWVSEQLEERKRQRLKDDEEKRLEVDAARQRLWSPYARQVALTHELNIAWKQSLDLFSWDRVLSLEDLKALRITGHALVTLPTALAHSLTALTVLSLIATGLEILPENIGDLQLLVEIDLTKNQLRRLPDSITTLPCLTSLNLSSNLLEELPANFGALVLLDKLWLEHNKLTTLPTSIGRSRARIANFNANQLSTLPESIGEMVNLTALSLNMNKLKEFPDSFASLPKLESLHASQNQIAELPHNIGSLQMLRELRLDWNLVKQLPFSFRLLKHLKTLSLEKNPLRLPPIEYVIKGVPATMAFIERSLEEFIRNARRKIIERLQEILHFAAALMAAEHERASSSSDGGESSTNQQQQRDDDLDTVLSLFEPNCERVTPANNEKLAFFAVVWDEFYATLLPALERKRAQKDPKHPSFRFDAFTSDEVDDALQHYTDDFGAASMKDSAEFRKCCCIDALEWHQHGVRKRKVCIPGQVPYRCRRDALLVRMQMMTHEEAKDQLASTYLKKKIERLVAKTKRKCVEYINSEPGVEHFEALAHELAKSLCQKRKRLKKLRRQHDKETQVFGKKKQKLQARVDAFRRARDARLADLREKLEKLEGDKRKLKDQGDKRDAKRIEKVEAKVKKVTTELAQEPMEDKKILELEIALEAIEDAELKATAAIEKAKAKEMRSDDDVNGGGSSDSDESAAREQSDDEDENENEEDGSDDGDSSSGADENNDPEDDDQSVHDPRASSDASAAPGGTKFFQIDMPELKFVDYRRAATRTIERELGDDRDTNEEELAVLYQTHIRDAYVVEKCERVAQKATHEFLQMRVVLKRWMGLGNRAVFEAWRDLVRANREDAEKVREKLARKKLVEQQNRELEEQLARLEARKWVQCTDIYTDAIYFEHSVTGETSWYPPTYWDEEQEKQLAAAAKHKVPALKLPPI